MANLKKLLAGAMALCMAGAMFASCGPEESKNDSKSGNTNAGTNDNKGGEEGGNEGGNEGGDAAGDLKEEKLPNIPQNVAKIIVCFEASGPSPIREITCTPKRRASQALLPASF